MASYQLTSAVLGLLVAGLIIWLVRRDHLHGKYAIWWLIVAAAFAVLGLVPRFVDLVANNLGIAYPPILIVLLGFGFLVLKMVTMDIERSKSMVKLHRLAQRIAMLEGEMETNRKPTNDPQSHGETKN